MLVEYRHGFPAPDGIVASYRMCRKLSGALSCFLLLCPAVRAQKKTEYRTGHLLKIEDVTIGTFEPGDTYYKTDLLLYIREGSDEYVAHYRVTIFGHDKSKVLKPDTDVSFRVSGKSLFVKPPDGTEMKSRLCEKVQIRGVPGDALKCGDMTYLGRDIP